jgi:hypothetical protein
MRTPAAVEQVEKEDGEEGVVLLLILNSSLLLMSLTARRCFTIVLGRAAVFPLCSPPVNCISSFHSWTTNRCMMG